MLRSPVPCVQKEYKFFVLSFHTIFSLPSVFLVMGKQENEKETENYVDIADFVMEVERFSKLIEPFAFCLFAVDDVRRLVYVYNLDHYWKYVHL